MDQRTFILRCKQIVNECTRLLQGDSPPDDAFQTVLTRMETLKRCLECSRGRLMDATAVQDILENIDKYIQEVKEMQQGAQQDEIQYQASLVSAGTCGPPRYNITREQLSVLFSCDVKISQMARILGVSLSTIKRRIRFFELSASAAFASMGDEDLDDLIRDVVGSNHQLGAECVRAILHARGIRVQRRRVRQSLRRINPQAAALRAMSRRLRRRSYQVPGPNSLWHIDGNHKLIRWRIVIHGGIDGYSRLVVFLRASNNNRSATVLENFLAAISRFGVPSAIRTDHGGENNDVCLLMNVFRGSRHSALRGASVHNQRIERLWGDLWRGVVNVYSDIFHFLETEEFLNIDNDLHLWALHYVYLPRLNRDLNLFLEQWNHHGLRTEHYQSPLQLFLTGCLRQYRQPTAAVQELLSPYSVTGTTNTTESVTQRDTAQADDFDWYETVRVPQNHYAPETDQIQQVQHQFDPLGGPREQLGMEIYQGVVTFLESLT